MTFKIISTNISAQKGEKKSPVASIVLRENYGIIGDAHAGNWHRQVSLLASEDIKDMQKQGALVTWGDFAENLTTKGIEIAELPLGTHLIIGRVILEITQIGKECHKECAIRVQIGDCVMPRKGVFARVIHGGEILHEDIGSYSL